MLKQFNLAFSVGNIITMKSSNLVTKSGFESFPCDISRVIRPSNDMLTLIEMVIGFIY